MFRRKDPQWEHAQGTIIEYGPDEMALVGDLDQSPVHVYLIHVLLPSGQVTRATVRGSSGVPLPIGTVVAVEVNRTSQAIRFDPQASTPAGAMAAGISASMHSPRSTAEALKLAATLRAQMASGGPAAAAAAAAAAMQHGTGTAAGPGMHVVGGPEAAQLMQEMFSGDPAQRAAAIEHLRQLRSGMAAGVTGHTAADGIPPTAPGSFTTPSTFDPVTPSGSFSTPATPGTFGQVTPPSFSTPSTFDQVTPPGSFAAPVTPSTFDAVSPINTFASGSGAGSPADRIAKLQELRDKGLITAPEFEAQRQRILDEI